MKVEILGTGCYNCIKLERLLNAVVDELGAKNVEITRVSDEKRIRKYMPLDEIPGLLIDGILVSTREIPDHATLAEWLSGVPVAGGKMSDPILRVEDLWLRRNGREILRGVNLEVHPGQVHVLLGLNGSGKSSLAYAIMGCEGYTPDSGRILFDGQDLAGLSITERARRGITLAWQEPARFEGIPIGKYVSLGQQQPYREQVVAALEAVSLPAKYYGYRAADQTLSGGERKRVELAAVYAMRPKLAILDEPDSGIDVLTLGDIAMLIRRMAMQGTAVLLITHRDEMVETADAASLMCAGAVIFTGGPLEARRYFSTRCIPHLESLGSQPWDITKPEVQAALASNGLLLKKKEN